MQSLNINTLLPMFVYFLTDLMLLRNWNYKMFFAQIGLFSETLNIRFHS